MRFATLFALAMVAMAAVTANAVDHTWTGATDNNWLTGSNWDAGTAPASSDNILINTGTPVYSEAGHWLKVSDSAKITIDGGDTTWDVRRIHVGMSGTWGNMDIKSGNLTYQYTYTSTYPKFNVGDQGNGYVNQTGGNVLVDVPTNPGLDANSAKAAQTLQLAGGDRAGIWHISGGTLNVGKLGNGWDGRGEFKVIGDDATITLRGEAGPGSQAYWQNSRSKLIYDIGSGISKIDATGSICNIGGTLIVNFTEVPTVGERFTLMEYGTLIHGFDSYDLTVDSPWGPDTVELALHYGDRSDDIMEVEVLAVYGAIPGDLNGDGAVNSGDLDIVRGAWEETVEAGCLPCGDPSGDGVVNSADLDIVRANWGAGVTPVPVPEPAVCSLLFAALALASIRRWRR